MNLTRRILRIVFFLLAISQLFYLIRKTDDQAKTVAEFKYEMYKKVQADTLDSKHKLDMVFRETDKFMDSSAHVKKGLHNLTGLFALWVVIEFIFLIFKKRRAKNIAF
jgi:hypothetical protein